MLNIRQKINQLRVAFFIPVEPDNSDRVSSPEDQSGDAHCSSRPTTEYGQCRYSTPCVDYVGMIPNIYFKTQVQSALVSPLLSPFDRPITSYCTPRIIEICPEKRLRVLDFSANVRQGYRNQFHQYYSSNNSIFKCWYSFRLNLFF